MKVASRSSYRKRPHEEEAYDRYSSSSSSSYHKHHHRRSDRSRSPSSASSASKKARVERTTDSSREKHKRDYRSHRHRDRRYDDRRSYREDRGRESRSRSREQDYSSSPYSSSSANDESPLTTPILLQTENSPTLLETERQQEYQRLVEQQLQQQQKQEQSEEELRRQRLERRKAILAKYSKSSSPSSSSSSSDHSQQQPSQHAPQLSSAGETTVVEEETNEKNRQSPQHQSHQSSLLSNNSTVLQDVTTTAVAEEVKKDNNSNKEEDLFDMFSDCCESIPLPSATAAMVEGGELQNDTEGYYCPRFGELLGPAGRYKVLSTFGRGVFSVVVRAQDLQQEEKEKEEVAVKLMRNNEAMKRTGRQEVAILQRLSSIGEPEKSCCIRFLSHFEDRDHLCLVFEPMSVNLRELLKKHGKNIGFPLNAVKLYAFKLFCALYHLKQCRVLHCDIKPDNILVDESNVHCKLADFGSACFFEDTCCNNTSATPYVGSRWYRAPEVILGLPHHDASSSSSSSSASFSSFLSPAYDMWSVGVTLFELYTGRPMFQGNSNNDMLRLFQEAKGPFPKKLLRQSHFATQHFNSNFQFLQQVGSEPLQSSPAAIEQPQQQKVMVKVVTYLQNEAATKKKDRVKKEVMAVAGAADDASDLHHFVELLHATTALDPRKRITPEEALRHPFFRSYHQQQRSSN
ncbi:Serine/threonine protein kinase YAK1 [Balamuthia mandrillaris]